MAEADILTIPSGARNPKAAWEFIKYVNSSNPDARPATNSAAPSSWTSSRRSSPRCGYGAPYFEHHHPHPHIAILRRLAASPHA